MKVACKGAENGRVFILEPLISHLLLIFSHFDLVLSMKFHLFLLVNYKNTLMSIAFSMKFYYFSLPTFSTNYGWNDHFALKQVFQNFLKNSDRLFALAKLFLHLGKKF